MKLRARADGGAGAPVASVPTVLLTGLSACSPWGAPPVRAPVSFTLGLAQILFSE